MKNKKMFYFMLIGIFIVGITLANILKPMTMNDIYDKPNFKGVVTKIDDNLILVSVDKNEDEINSGDKMSVSLDVKLKDSMTNFEVGDKVHIFYDGSIAEIYPGRIRTVYAILLVNE